MIHPYLQTVIDLIKNVQFSEGYCVLDSDFVTIAVDDKLLEYWGDPDLIGKRLKHSNSAFAIQADEYFKPTQKFLASDAKSVKEVALSKNQEFTDFFDVTMSKIVDPETSQFVGVGFFYNRLWLDAGLVDILSNSKSQVYAFYHESNLPENLTLAEHEIIWLLVAGKSQKEIAYILSHLEQKKIDRNRVASLINRSIYLKFAVNDLAGLIAKLGGTELMSSISTRLYDYFRQKK